MVFLPHFANPVLCFSLLGLGLALGGLSGLLGIGGGLLLLPALLYGLPLLTHQPPYPFVVVTVLAAWQGLLGTLFGLVVHSKRGNWHPQAVKLALPGALLGAYGGAWLTGCFSERALTATMAVILAWTLGRTLWQLNQQRQKLKSHPDVSLLQAMVERPALGPWAQVILLFASWLIGSVAGVLGIGGAILLLPVLTDVLKLPLRQAIGSSSYVVAAICLASVVGKGLGGVGLPPHSLWLLSGACAGGLIGARFQPFFSDGGLKRVYLALVGVALLKTLSTFLPH